MWRGRGNGVEKHWISGAERPTAMEAWASSAMELLLEFLGACFSLRDAEAELGGGSRGGGCHGWPRGETELGAGHRWKKGALREGEQRHCAMDAGELAARARTRGCVAPWLEQRGPRPRGTPLSSAGRGVRSRENGRGGEIGRLAGGRRRGRREGRHGRDAEMQHDREISCAMNRERVELLLGWEEDRERGCGG